MKVTSDILRCYIEGIYVPVKSVFVEYSRNKLMEAKVEIPIVDVFVDKMWANAFVQVTYVDNNGVERLLCQGLCRAATIFEITNMMLLHIHSIFGILNLNKTLDYIAPRKYQIFNIEAEDSKIYIGDESLVYPTPPENGNSYLIAFRYFFLSEEARSEEGEFTPGEEYKLEFIINKAPFATRFAFVLFELLAYENFILTRAYVDRFNLLRKSKTKEKIDKEQYEHSVELAIETIPLDIERTADIYKRMKRGKKEDVKKGSGDDAVLGNGPLNWEVGLSLDEACRKIAAHRGKNFGGYSEAKGSTTEEKIKYLFAEYCYANNISAILTFAISGQESEYGTKETGAKTKNPGNVGNSNTSNNPKKTWKDGWEAIPKEIIRRIRKHGIKNVRNLAGLEDDGSLAPASKYPCYASKWANGKYDKNGRYVSDAEETKHRQAWVNGVTSIYEEIKKK